jgi:hypothetical protein
MGAQQPIAPQIKGVLHVPGGVMLRDVQGAEVVVVGFDLGSFRHPVAEAGKDVDDLLDRADQRVALAGGAIAAGGGHIQPFPLQPLVQGALLHRFKALIQQRLHQFLEPVGPLTHQGPLLPRQLAHRPEHRRQTSFLAQQAHPQILELGGRHRLMDGCRGLILEGIELIGELLQADRGAHGRLG